MLEFLNKAGTVIGTFSVIAAFIVPDWIAGVNKAMRMGHQYYPKEARRKKWKWIGIFLGIAALGIALALLTGGFIPE